MKTLIFICLKIAELIGACIVLAIFGYIFYIVGVADWAEVGVGGGVGYLMLLGMTYIIAILAIVAIAVAIIAGIFCVFKGYIIPANIKWTNQIYNKYFK